MITCNQLNVALHHRRLIVYSEDTLRHTPVNRTWLVIEQVTK